MKNSGGAPSWGATLAHTFFTAVVDPAAVVTTEWLDVVEGDYFEVWCVSSAASQSLLGPTPASGALSWFQIELANAPRG
jgi:hypothetical protein